MEKRQINLDFLRGMAALAVVVGHLRTFLLVVDKAFLINHPILSFFYFICGLQGQAVTLFFVLSGYFIGGAIIKDNARARWSWSRYSIQRLTRLWTVLLPALILTFVLDSLGKTMGDYRYFNGSQDNWICFFKNLFFLQTISGGVYGTNGPLWSLANEFWYYLLFPLFYLALFGKKSLNYKALCALLFTVSLFFLPANLTLGGGVWLMGVAAFICVSTPGILRWTGNPFFFMAACLFFVWSLYFSYGQDPIVNPNYLVGFSTACLLPFLATHRWDGVGYTKISRVLSDISYTLYLVHFPLLVFFFYTLKIPTAQMPSWNSCALFALILLCVLIYAWCVWYLFERHTHDVRKFCERRLTPGK